ncbi:filamentous hemagglutinin N-terminal domain-containing protein [Moraxella bovis]|uniref:Hemolysin n=1 Tax=Moraxella bovis TaxID=476 RepID=A0A378PPB6_MORBO|nr:filamentous hemagglutinin N-terminal domain-containing protein [Moraxella bovis]STY88584.1 Hemolysin precursor [Moraxella bovis]
MNHHLHRVIFSKHLQRLVVVSEKTVSQGKSGSQGGSESNAGLGESQIISQNRVNAYYGKWATLCGAVFIGLGLANLSYANPNPPTTIIADPSAPKNLQPTILPTASGIVSVNIATPNDKGLSNNHYSQFDVGSTGAVLNNNRKAVNTQIAGYVQANPFMAKGEASTILNQINSNNPSHLGGFIEVAGKRADVIIANPNGLVINGTGFINAGNVHLVAANGKFDQGQITGYQVNTGNIEVNGKLNLQNTDYAALIAKTAQINDEIYAGSALDIVTGENTVALQDGKFNQLSAAHKNDGASSTNQTGIALDVAALGGMYAGKIRLIGTDKGFGVNNQGMIAATGSGVQAGTGTLTLDHQGNLVNTGIASAKDKVTINTQSHHVRNAGTLLGEQSDIAIDTDNDKLLANNLQFSTDGKIINQSQLTAGQDLTLSANHIDNTQTGTIKSGNHTQITSQTSINNQGLINGETTVIKANDTINNQSGGRIYGTHLAIQADTLNNTPAKAEQSDGKYTAPVIAARERLDIGVKTLNNNPNPDRAGKFNENFDNQALITSLGSLHIGGSLDDNHYATGKADAVINQGATIESGGEMQINTSVLKNENADFKSKVEQRGEPVAVTEYFVNNNTYVQKEGEVYIQEGGWDGNWLKTLVTPDGRFQNYSSYEYLKTDYITKTISSDPAMVRSGGALLFDFKQASNIDSVVISGDTARLNQDPTHAEYFGFTNHASSGEDYHTQADNKYFNYVTSDRRRRDNPTSKRPYTYKNLGSGLKSMLNPTIVNIMKHQLKCFEMVF